MNRQPQSTVPIDDASPETCRRCTELDIECSPQYTAGGPASCDPCRTGNIFCSRSVRVRVEEESGREYTIAVHRPVVPPLHPLPALDENPPDSVIDGATWIRFLSTRMSYSSAWLHHIFNAFERAIALHGHYFQTVLAQSLHTVADALRTGNESIRRIVRTTPTPAEDRPRAVPTELRLLRTRVSDMEAACARHQEHSTQRISALERRVAELGRELVALNADVRETRPTGDEE
ncbi:hypothetical protein PUNSTDRAFT_48002 [Punctularia strigosozonata HHB-11173 SS5]|uniref:Zn(2)-C6 fungal-type domain-containing protein n=1 Tax=Punctularia strigosozonata (strain HHB-11173) TaxID=741275 RepID=R7S0Z3_PUNST|nr:uncharacterized protein PUNSTDRAFT_48002 [Punctularia strigosozonata HHB-11173 SS5]EIN03519.1 hypothetical protein PUNSTDRAFT_48002 [Punctularia strigosozonata HHB-11173 SS5]